MTAEVGISPGLAAEILRAVRIVLGPQGERVIPEPTIEPLSQRMTVELEEFASGEDGEYKATQQSKQADGTWANAANPITFDPDSGVSDTNYPFPVRELNDATGLEGRTVDIYFTFDEDDVGLWVFHSGVGLSDFAFQAKRDGTNQIISGSTFTKIGYNAIVNDPKSDYDIVLARYTPSSPGEYIVTAVGNLENLPDPKQVFITLYKNGVEHVRGNSARGRSSGGVFFIVACQVTMNGTTDFLEIFLRHDDTTSKTFEGFNNRGTASFSAQNIGL